MNKIFIAGSGGIGQAAGLILAEYYKGNVEIVFGDISKDAGDAAIEFVASGSDYDPKLQFAQMGAEVTDEDLKEVLHDIDVLLDCLPGRMADSPQVLQSCTTLTIRPSTRRCKERWSCAWTLGVCS